MADRNSLGAWYLEREEIWFSFCMRFCPDNEMKIKLTYRNREFMCRNGSKGLERSMDVMIKCVLSNYFIFYLEI